MDQYKMGRFIAECRKKEKLTKMQLAKKLNITDRAVSKWENGKSIPDASIMLELCNILKITVNDLFYGEVVTMQNYNKVMEQNLIKIAKEKEQSDKELLSLEIFICTLVSIVLFTFIFIASFLSMPNWLRISLIISGIIQFAVGIGYAIKIEQTAGYYQCSKCHHKYIPTYNSVLWSMHINRARYMRCPKCHQKSWQKRYWKEIENLSSNIKIPLKPKF